MAGRRFKKRKNPSLLRRWIGLALLLAMVLSGIFVYRTLFSPERVNAWVTRLLSDGLGRPVGLRSVLIHPFAGRIHAESVNVGFMESERMESGAFLTLDRLEIRFRLLPLFRRQLEITSISIEGPHLNLVSMPGEKPAPKEAQKTESLPVSLGVGALRLQDFRFVLTIPDSAGKSELIADGVCLNVDKVRIPRQYTETGRVQGGVLLFVNEGTLTYTDRAGSFSFPLRAEIQGFWPPGNEWDVKGHITLGSRDDPDSARVRLWVNAGGAGYGDRLDLEELSLSLDGQKVVFIAGTMETNDTGTVVDFRLKDSSFSMNGIMSTLAGLLPEGRVAGIAGLRADGQCSLTGRLQGDLNALKVRLRLALQDCKADLASAGWAAGQIQAMVEAYGTAGKQGFTHGRFGAELSAGFVSMAGMDSAEMTIKNIGLEASGTLNSGLMPESGSLYFLAGSILDSPAELRIHWAMPADSVLDMNRLVIGGTLSGDSLNLGILPGVAQIDGRAQVHVDVEAQGLNKISVHAAAFSLGLGYGTGAAKESTPPLKLDIRLCGGLSPDQRYLLLDSAGVRLNDLLKASLSGALDLKDNTLDASLEELRIENDQFDPFLPKTLRRQMRDAVFFGHEIIRARIRGSLSGILEESLIQGQLLMNNAGIDQPSGRLAVRDARLRLDFSGTPQTMNGDLALGIGSLKMDTLRIQMPAGDLVSCRVSTGDNGIFAEGMIHLDTLGISGNFNGRLGQNQKNQEMDAFLNVRFGSADTVEIIPGFSLQGEFACRLEAATLDTVENGMRLSALVRTEALNAAYGNRLVLNRIDCRIPLEFHFNIKQQKLIPVKPEPSIDWVEYEGQRGVYEKLGLIHGYLRMEQARFGEYALQSLDMDIDAERGILRIPWFAVRIFGGNVGGSMEVEPGSGGREDISYRIRAQASRIRAAALTPVMEKNAEEDTELDATLAFQGKGIDPQGSLDLEGFFYITKMGPRFASTLLGVMDPQGSDRSIRLTRRLLDMGWKPKLFSFELRHGYVYPALALSQPWFSPIRIPGQLQYGRLPLEFFLKYKSSQ